MTETETQATVIQQIAPEVIIDGVRYVPSGAASASLTLPRIGVGITTHNRGAVLAESLEHHRQHLPPNAEIVVVDDASTPPVDSVIADYRFDENVGIARAKNKCIELLMAADPAPDHIFLFDDDTYPVADGWHLPYIESPEPHLMYQFNTFANGQPIGDAEEVPTDSEHYALTNARGPMLYLDTRILPIVGGMDPAFGLFGYEHGDWSNRIHHAGLTTWRYADVRGSEAYIHSKDEHLEVERSVPRAIRQESVAHNEALFRQRIESHDASYIDYREPRDVILTALYTHVPDPQRPGQRGIDPHAADNLMNSLRGLNVVFTTDDDNAGDGAVEIIRDTPTMSVYFARHLAHLRYLRAHPEIRYAWCVDATDVVLQLEAWAAMEPGKLYIGYEPTIVGCDWMREHSPMVRDLDPATVNLPLLNIGVHGGDRETLIEYLQAVLDIYFDNRAAAGELDMGAANLAAYRRFADRIVTGPPIVTRFKANERNTWSIWRHK